VEMIDEIMPVKQITERLIQETFDTLASLKTLAAKETLA